METVKFIIALWGAATGSVALCIQLVNYWRDRAVVGLKPSIAFVADLTNPKGRFVFTLEIVNHGRRPVYIESAAIVLPITTGFPKGSWNQESTMTVYGNGRATIALQEGQKTKVGIDPFHPDFAALLGKVGKCYAIDTKGTKFCANFEVPTLPNKPTEPSA